MTGLDPVPTLVTGGAGFIGGEFVASLLADGSSVTVLDDLSTAEPDWMERFRGVPGFRFVLGDAADKPTVQSAMVGHERVIHLASGTDIAGGFEHPERDFRNGVLATEVVCEAMQVLGVRELWYASSGVVYGRPVRVPTAEGDGPLRPESHYAAAKLAGEAIVSGFAHLYDWRAFAFRFGNTVGARSNHGVVHDLVVKLLRDPAHLEILGDGTPAKPYVAVTDLVGRHATRRSGGPGSRPDRPERGSGRDGQRPSRRWHRDRGSRPNEGAGGHLVHRRPCRRRRVGRGHAARRLRYRGDPCPGLATDAVGRDGRT